MDPIRLTWGIPTIGGRPELLDRAIGSALSQSVPARVLVSCQGTAEALSEAKAKWADHPLVHFIDSPAACLWENWVWAAASCSTELFAWLQDDDVLAAHATRRVTGGFDTHSGAAVYMARLGISFGEGLANWWEATGPMVPMDLLRGTHHTMASPILAAGAYWTSHALSPGVAFRCTSDAIEAIKAVPKDADLFAERTVLAALSRFGSAVCDPAIVGYWVHHAANESRTQNMQAGEGDRQYRRMCRFVDPIVAAMPHWQDAMRGFAYLVGRRVAEGWHKHAWPFRDDSPVCGESVAILEELYPDLRREPEPEPEPTTAPSRQVTPETTVDPRPRRAERAIRRG